jgi:hypothetical protein
MTIDVEIRLIAVHALTHGVGHPPHGENVAGTVKGKGVAAIHAFSGHHLAMNRLQTRIVSLKFVQVRHPFDNTAENG